jgi:hypothetical protein
MTQLKQVQIRDQVLGKIKVPVKNQLSDHVWVKSGVAIGGQLGVEVRVKVWYQVMDQINDTT